VEAEEAAVLGSLGAVRRRESCFARRFSVN